MRRAMETPQAVDGEDDGIGRGLFKPWRECLSDVGEIRVGAMNAGEHYPIALALKLAATGRTGLRETASSSTPRSNSKPGAPFQTVFLRFISSISEAQDLASGSFSSERENGGRVLDGAAESIPIGNGDAVCDSRRDLAEVEHDGAESAGVEQRIGGFERVSGVVAAADPEELRERDSGCGGGDRVEGIVGIDVSANLVF